MGAHGRARFVEVAVAEGADDRGVFSVVAAAATGPRRGPSTRWCSPRPPRRSPAHLTTSCPTRRVARCACMAVNIRLDDLPDPDDHDAAWHDDEPAYLAWWGRLRLSRVVGTPSPTRRRLLVDQQHAQVVHPVLGGRPDTVIIDELLPVGPILEVGGGRGYWARLLRDRGADVLASDIESGHGGGCDTADRSPWTGVVTADRRMAWGRRY